MSMGEPVAKDGLSAPAALVRIRGGHAQLPEGADGVGDLAGVEPLVEVESAVQRQDRNAFQLAQDQPSGVALYRGDGKSRNFGVGQVFAAFDALGQTAESGSGDQGYGSGLNFA